MIWSDRTIFSRRAIVFLFLLFGIPAVNYSAALEDSAKDLVQKITAALPAQATVHCEFRNISSLRPDEVSRVERTVQIELQNLGVRLSESTDAAVPVSVTLSENWADYIWTAEIHERDTSPVVFLAVPRANGGHFPASATPLKVRAEKFWEGKEHIMDATQVAGIGGSSWIVLLLMDHLVIQEPTGKLEIPFSSATTRDPFGKLGPEQDGHTISFSLGSRECKVDLDFRRLGECFPADAPAAGGAPGRTLIGADLSPTGPSLPDKGMELVIASVCGGANQFLATSARDYTQTDTLQVFQMESGGPVAMSAELNFPGPILALHESDLSTESRAIVRNLSTGNYEAYRLAISCSE